MEKKISLDGKWKYKPLAWAKLKEDGKIHYSYRDVPRKGIMSLPLNWHLAGLEKFTGKVVFEKEINIKKLDVNKLYFIVFKGADYFTEVFINNKFAGKHEGYFQAFEFDITKFIKNGKNNIKIYVISPMEEPGAVWPARKWLIKGVFNQWDCRPGGWSKKLGQKFNTGGIWNNCYLESRNQTNISDFKVYSVLKNANKTAKIIFNIGINSIENKNCILKIKLDNRIFNFNINAKKGQNKIIRTIPVDNPKLWWTWDHGNSYLYNCSISLLNENKIFSNKKLKIGIRTIAVNPKTGIWILNGRRIFIRGTNIMPEQMLSQYSDERIRKDVLLAKKANINAFRVHAHVNRDEFYSECDKAGILVWQDFPLQWGYSLKKNFIEKAKKQVKDMINLLYNHPSIALWCCHNEADKDNTEKLDPELARAGREAEKVRLVHQTSAFEEHAYYGWYTGHYRQASMLPDYPMLTEFGAQGLPSAREFKNIAGNKWPPDWKKLAYHNFQFNETFCIAKVPAGNSLKEFIENSQNYQALVLKSAIEACRQKKYNKTGCMFQFSFVDCWDAVTWSLLSYKRIPKKAYYDVKNSYKPVLAGMNLGQDVWRKKRYEADHFWYFPLDLWVVNDTFHNLNNYDLEVKLGGRKIFSRNISIKADSSLKLPSQAFYIFPDKLKTGQQKIIVNLKNKNKLISSNSYDIKIIP